MALGVLPLGLLDLLPVEEDLLCRVGLDGSEHVGMAADELFVDRPEDVADLEERRFFGHARVKDDLEHDVAKLLAELARVTLVDRFQDLVGLLDEVRLDAPMRLLPIPRAAGLAPEARHDPDQFAEQFVCRLGHGRSPGDESFQRSAISFRPSPLRSVVSEYVAHR